MATKKVLLALDLSDVPDALLQRIVTLKNEDVDLHICSAIMPLDLMYSVAPLGSYGIAVQGFEKEITESAEKQLADTSRSLMIASDKQHLLFGKAASAIKVFAKDNDFDLIVVGSHGKNAISAMLGSTSSGVLHGAPCDVLAVRC